MTDQAARPPDHQQHHGRAEHQHAELFKTSEQFKARRSLRVQRGRDAELPSPMPPSTTMASTSADSWNVNDSGLMKPWRVAKNAPAKPPNIAPVANAVSLVVVVLMPSERHATSSSRSASHALPIGRRRRRMVTQLVSSASARIR